MRTNSAASTAEPDTAPLELDDDLRPRDAWMFAPLFAVIIALPIVASALFALSAWHLVSRDEASLSAPASTFASRWPEQSLPVVR